MKAALSLVALAASALGANVGRTYPKETPDKPKDSWQTVTTKVIVTYTTVCPVTETVNKPGTTYYTTYTTTKTTEKVVPTTIIVTKQAPPVTKTANSIVYTTLTELCPVTETKVIEGSTVEVVWTSTSTVVTRVAQTQTVYTTEVETEYLSTKVFETVTCPEVVYTTVVAGETVYRTKTSSITLTVSKVATVTAVVPVTITRKVDVTVPVTKSSQLTMTDYSTVVVSEGETIYSTEELPPTTIIIPTTSTKRGTTIISTRPVTSTTSTISVPQNTTIPVIPTAAAHKLSPGVALLAGFIGAAVLA
jgi:hypothetical protein